MPIRKTRNVSLTPELDVFIDGRVAAGRYRTASAALRLLESAEAPHRGREDPEERGATVAASKQ
jgi:antitoxin ParD1/3/4